MDTIRSYWPIFISLAGILVSLVAQWAVFGVRLNALEDKQDKQEQSIMAVRDLQVLQTANYAELKAKLESVGDNVNYIRSRIDSATK